MKTKLLAQFFGIACLTSSLVCTNSFAQQTINVGSQEYQQMKLNGTLPQQMPMVNNSSNSILSLPTSSQSATVSTSTEYNCNCLMQIDSSFSLVPFNIGVAPYYVNDDGYSNSIALPFSFCYYGQQVDSVYINNNGNISFVNPYSAFTADGFPSAAYNMIAPFWGDVDTRGNGGGIVYDSLGNPTDTLTGASHYGLVYYKITPTALIVKWDSVGYFPIQGDKRNTFQLIITNGSDPLVPGGNNVSFCYGDMQWTTGSASGGANGFGGTPATVGANKGDNINFFQVGRFDHDGIDYDGPDLNADGISFLDNSAYLISTCTSNNNIPPIALTSVCDSIVVVDGDTTIVEFIFIGPENNQVVTASVEISNPNYSVLSNVSGNPCVVTVQVVGSPQRSSNDIIVTATDNGVPAASNVQTINVASPQPIVTAIKNANPKTNLLMPNPSNGIVNINFAKEGHKNVRVINSLGSVVLAENTSNNNLLLDITSQSKGFYFVEIKTNNSVDILKLIVE